VHSPTLLTLTAILMAMVTAVLFAVWHFNKQIPGLRLWMLSYLFGFLFSVSFLQREQLPPVLTVVLTQCAALLTGYLCLIGSRAYLGRPPLHHGYAVVLMVALVGMAVHFTAVQPNPGMRFLAASVGPGVFYLLTAHTLAHGGMQVYPARYLMATITGLHGIFVLLRPLLFKLRMSLHPDADMAQAISQFVILEAIVALVLIAFGVLMLANEFTTSALRRLAEMDPLTSVFNRRAFLTLLDKAISQARRTQSELPVLVIDLDHFKRINDTWGHQCGDDVLRHFVGLAVSCLRKEDVMGRLGGEEFAIVLPNATPDGARVVAERLCALVAERPVMTEHGPIAVTVSVGVTQCTVGETPEVVLHRADAAMYQAKQRGRNRVEVSFSRPALAA